MMIICLHTDGFKYFYPVPIIFKQIYGTLTGVTTPGQGETHNIGNEEMTTHAPGFQKYCVATGCSLESFIP